MIVTRQRRKPFPYKRLILPLIAIALIVFALVWAPSRNVVTSGPMAPAWRTAGNWMNVVGTPFHFAAQNQVITDRNRQIAILQTQLTAVQNSGEAKDKQITALQQQIDQLQTQAASSRAAPTANNPRGAAPKPGASAGPFGNQQTTGAAAPVGGDLTAGATADMRRTGQYWASMDPDNAAKVAQRLPPSYVARIFALMSPEAVGAILDALPPAYAAKLTQPNPELQR